MYRNTSLFFLHFHFFWRLDNIYTFLSKWKFFLEERKGHIFYIYNDYLYTIDNRYKNVFRCNLRRTIKCPDVVFQNNNTSFKIINIMKEHNHPKSPFIKEQMQMKEEMLRLCRETHTEMKEIFDSVCRSNLDAAKYLSFASLRCTMHRERIKNRPSVPNTLASLYDTLQNSDIMQNIFKEKVITSDEKTAIIFSTNYLLETLSSITEIYVDGTFSVLPRKPHIAQLYSVHVRYMDTGIATLFILCEVRTSTMYDALWNKITQIIPQLQTNIKFIMSDFETAAIKSLNNKFPTANLTGCWFHFNQAVLRKWRKLHLSNVPKTVLSMTMTLPLLPPDMFQEALTIIQTEADLLSSEHSDILQFMSYLRLTWLNMASKISTYHCPVRTNNIVESFHNIAAQKLGVRNINVWTFLDKLSHLIIDQELDLRRLNNSIRPRRPRTRANRELNLKIINAQEDLVNKRLSLKEFLLMFANNNNMTQMEYMTSLEDAELINDEHVDIELFTDNLDEAQTTGRQRSNSRRIYRSHNRNHNQREVHNTSGRVLGNEDNRENSPNINRENSSHSVQTNEQPEINITFHLENTEYFPDTQIIINEINITPDLEDNNAEHFLDSENNNDNVPDLEDNNDADRSSDIQTVTIEQTNTINSNDNIYEIQDDESIYQIPEDDYAYLNSASSEVLPFHDVNWNFKDNNDQSTSDKESSMQTCTVCFVNERTHAFIPCGHLACCFQCVARLETNRCPICNVIFQNHIQIRTP